MKHDNPPFSFIKIAEKNNIVNRFVYCYVGELVNLKKIKTSPLEGSFYI